MHRFWVIGSASVILDSRDPCVLECPTPRDAPTCVTEKGNAIQLAVSATRDFPVLLVKSPFQLVLVQTTVLETDFATTVSVNAIRDSQDSIAPTRARQTRLVSSAVLETWIEGCVSTARAIANLSG